MNRKELQKQFNKYILLSLLGVVVFIGFVIGGALAMESESIILGVVLFFLGILALVVTFLIIVKVSKRFKPILLSAFYNEIKNKIEKESGKTVFTTNDNMEVTFDEEHYLYDGQEFKYEDNYAMIFLERKVSFRSDEVNIFLQIDAKEESFFLPLDGDLLKIIKSKKMEVINMEDLDYFLENPFVSSKQIIRTIAFQPNTSYLPLLLVKNKEDMKARRKLNTKLVIMNAVFIIALLGVFALFTWLGETEKGLEISDTVTFNIGFKILFSLVILFLTFFKAKDVKWYGKVIFILYLLTYWFGILFLTDRMNLFITFLYFFAFIILGFLLLDKKQLKTNPVNRLVGFSMFLMLLILFSAQDYKMIGEGRVAAISGIVSAIATIASIIIVVLYYKRKRKKEEVEKRKYLATIIGTFFATALISFLLLFFSIQGLNYCLDSSPPTIINKEIIELVRGDDNESDAAKVIIEGKEIEIPISTSLYFELEIGDILEISVYSGAFGLKYYIIE